MNILFCQPTMEYTGSERSLLGIIRIIRNDVVDKVFLLAGAEGPMTGDFQDAVDGMWFAPSVKLTRSATGWPAYLRSFWTVFRRIRTLKRTHSISVVYVNTLMFPQALVGAFLNRLQCVVHIREVESKYPWLFYQAYLALATLLADRIVCVCDYILRQKRIVLRARLANKARVVHNSSSFDMGPMRRTIDGPVQILTVGGLSRLKGAGDLVPFAKTLRAKNEGRGFTLRVVGRSYDDRLYREIAEGVAAADLAGQVSFCGEQADILPFYEQAHVLLHPARSDVFPRVLVEAANASLPAITTDAGGCPESVVDGETGFVVPAGDAEAMAERVIRLVEDAALYQRMCANAFERYRTHFSPQRMIGQIHAVLADIDRVQD